MGDECGHHERRKDELPLVESTKYMLLEGRTLLPGVQALFGFQLMVSFQERFQTELAGWERGLHLAALMLTAAAAALLMTPAAYHRQTNPETVSDRLLTVCGRLMLASMPLLAAAVCLDVYLVARVTVGSWAAAGLAGLLFALLTGLWLVLPRVKRLRCLLGGV